MLAKSAGSEGWLDREPLCIRALARRRHRVHTPPMIPGRVAEATRSNRARVGGACARRASVQRVAALALCSQVALLSTFDAGRAHAATDGLEAVFADGFEYGNECAWTIPATCEQGLVTVSAVALDEGSQFELAVHLARAPLGSPLEVTATIVDADGVAAVSGPLTFAPGNFGVDQSFTVTGLEDIDLDDPSGSAQVVLSVTSAQGSTPPEGVPDLAIPLQVTDDDAQEIVLSWAAPAPFVNSVQEEATPEPCGFTWPTRREGDWTMSSSSDWSPSSSAMPRF